MIRAFTLVALCLAGCENDVDNSENLLQHPDAAVVDANLVDAGDELCPAAGTWYVFDTLRITEIGHDETHGAIMSLNTIWADDIERKQLNILFEVTESTGTLLRVRAMNAARLDDDLDDWCRVPATVVDIVFNRAGDVLSMTEEAGINIYAGSESIPKICAPGVNPTHTIPVREALLEARLEGGCSRFADGVATKAVLFGDDLRQVCSCLIPGSSAEQCGLVDPNYDSGNFNCDGCNAFHRNLHALLGGFTGGEPAYEVGDDGLERLPIKATFTAVRLDDTPPVCP